MRIKFKKANREQCADFWVYYLKHEKIIAKFFFNSFIDGLKKHIGFDLETMEKIEINNYNYIWVLDKYLTSLGYDIFTLKINIKIDKIKEDVVE